jgi:hypothetical protein
MSFIPNKDQNKTAGAVYSVASLDFTATPGTGDKTVTIAGLPFTFTVINILSAFYYDASNVRHDLPLTTVSVTGAVITFTDKASNFAGTEEVEVYIAGKQKSGDNISDVTKVQDTNPFNLKQDGNGGALLSLTSIAEDTTDYGYIDMTGYRYLSIQGILSSGTTDTITVTIEASDQDDDTAMESCTYSDITLAMDGTASSFVDTSFFLLPSFPINAKYVRVKYVTSDTEGNDTDLTVYIRKMV